MSDNGRFSTFLVDQWMTQVQGMGKYLAAFSADPFTVGDPRTVEIVGGTYARQLGSFTRTDVHTLTMDAALVFRSLVPGTTIAAIGAFDASFNGNLLFRSMIVDGSGTPTPIVYTTGGTYSLAASELVVGMDIPGA